MNDSIMLKCRCGDYCFWAGTNLDLAEFLRCSIGAGWRRINEEPVKAVETADGTEIVLSGTCPHCDQRQPSLLARVFHRSAPARFQKAN